MKKVLFLTLIIAAMGCTPKKQALIYPETVKGETVDNYFGTDVPDPYRWLEDDRSAETEAWVVEQNKVTFDYLNQIPFRSALQERLTEIWNYPKMGAPFKEQDIYFYGYNTGLQNQSVIYMKNDLDAEGEIFLDPNLLSEDGTVALNSFSISNDAKYAGYGISRAGSDWKEFFIKDIATGEDLEDHLKWIKFSGMSWYGDGFYYSRYDEPIEGDELTGANTNEKVFYHAAGTDQAEDKLIYKDPENPERGFGINVTDDEKYLVIFATESTSGNAFGFKKAGMNNKPFTWLIDSYDNNYSPIGNKENIMYVLTNQDAPKYKLVAIDLNNPALENWTDIIPESEKVLEGCSLVGGHLIATYMKDAYNVTDVFALDGTYKHSVEFPGIGSVGGFGGKMKDEITFYTFTSFNYPPVIFKYNIAEDKSEVFYTSEVDFNGDDFVTKQVFFESKDGTKVPMFIVHKQGIVLDGTNPTQLYGYGGFNITYKPRFSVVNAVWMEQGGVYALAGIRGGGEYGEEWHKAGTILNKQNVFDDFIAASEYLIAENYATPERMSIIGGSNGGLLVGAVTNQRPDLYAAVIPAVGVMDMLRYHEFTIGRYWATDYGTSADSTQFEYLYKYSPVHNVSADKDYPAVMVTTADHDDRVVPAHSFKYIAELQDKYKGDNPVIIRIETDAGHGGGKPTEKIIAEKTDELAFFWYNMNFKPKF